jgi:hypothetical protein
VTGPAARETADDIITCAAAAGFAVTRRQLTRWHYQGWIPRPQQVWIDGRPGSEATYPAGTRFQVVVLCSIRKEFGRSINVGWLLWWLGFSVHQKHWKALLRREALRYDETIPQLNRLIKQGENLESLRTLRVRNVVFRQLRKRIGADKFADLFGLISVILQADFYGWNSGVGTNDPDIVRDKLTMDRALGLFRAENKQAIEKNTHLYDDVEQALTLLSSRLGGARLVEVLGDSSDDLIIRTRNELRGLLAIAGSATLFTDIPTKDQHGIKALAKFASAPTATHQLYLLFLLAMKEDSQFDVNFGHILNTFRTAVLLKTSAEQIEWLRKRDLALTEFLRPPLSPTLHPRQHG